MPDASLPVPLKTRRERRAPTTEAAKQRREDFAAQARAVTGRPTLYKPEHCNTVIRLGKQGFSPVQIAVSIGISRATLLDWGTAHEEFAAALSHARDCAQAWHEEKGRKSYNRKHFQAQVWKKTMESRFREDYAEQRSGLVEVATDFLAAIVESAGERQAKKLPAGADAKAIEGEASFSAPTAAVVKTSK